MTVTPRLLIAAHGTDSDRGRRTTEALVEAVSSARPAVDVSLCFLDVAEPSLRTALDGADGADGGVVVVPLLLSDGYHVRTGIPAVVGGRASVRVTRHLGPSEPVVDALVARLAEAGDVATFGSVALASVGSSRGEARDEVAAAAALLSRRLAAPVHAVSITGDVRAALSVLPGPVAVAPYLLAEGRFLSALTDAAAGIAVVAGPIGVHPSLVSLVLARYDEAVTD